MGKNMPWITETVFCSGFLTSGLRSTALSFICGDIFRASYLMVSHTGFAMLSGLSANYDKGKTSMTQEEWPEDGSCGTVVKTECDWCGAHRPCVLVPDPWIQEIIGDDEMNEPLWLCMECWTSGSERSVSSEQTA